jgi:hypothetical protein
MSPHVQLSLAAVVVVVVMVVDGTAIVTCFPVRFRMAHG